MKKLSVTYHAPKGDSKVVEIWGHTFYDGKAEEVIVEDGIYDTMKRNRFFECGKPTDLTDEQAEQEREKAATPQPEHAGEPAAKPGSHSSPRDETHHRGR